jgi:hypothetical protein
MFLFIRRTVVSLFAQNEYDLLTVQKIQTRLQTCKPMDAIFLESSEMLSRHESLEDELLSRAVRILPSSLRLKISYCKMTVLTNAMQHLSLVN